MGMFSGVGGFLNDITGASSAQNKQYQHSKALADRSFAQQKEFAQNQVQWYADDLEKAGFNRALSTGASSAGSGGATSGSTSAVTSGLDLLGGIVGAINQTRQTNAQTEQAGANSEYLRAKALETIEMLPISKKEKQAYIKYLNERDRGTSKKGISLGKLGTFGWESNNS